MGTEYRAGTDAGGEAGGQNETGRTCGKEGKAPPVPAGLTLPAAYLTLASRWPLHAFLKLWVPSL